MTAELGNRAALAEVPSEADVLEADSSSTENDGERLDALLAFVPETDHVPAVPAAAPRATPVPAAAPRPQDSAAALTPGVRSAELLALSDRTARVRLRGREATVDVAVAPEIDADLLKEALRDRQRVLVEWFGEGEPLVVGILQVHKPRQVTIRAEVVDIEASRSLSLRSGRAGLRMESEGEVELLGSRISVASRGLMRVIGRVLRLN